MQCVGGLGLAKSCAQTVHTGRQQKDPHNLVLKTKRPGKTLKKRASKTCWQFVIIRKAPTSDMSIRPWERTTRVLFIPQHMYCIADRQDAHKAFFVWHKASRQYLGLGQTLSSLDTLSEVSDLPDALLRHL